MGLWLCTRVDDFILLQEDNFRHSAIRTLSLGRITRMQYHDSQSDHGVPYIRTASVKLKETAGCFFDQMISKQMRVCFIERSVWEEYQVSSWIMNRHKVIFHLDSLTDSKQLANTRKIFGKDSELNF